MAYPKRRHYDNTKTGGSGSSAFLPGGSADEIPKKNGSASASTKLFSPSAGNFDLGDATLAGTSRALSTKGSGADVDLQISPKGSGRVKTSAQVATLADDYTSKGTHRIEDSASANRYLELQYANKGEYTADANADLAIVDTSSLPNNTIISLLIQTAGIKSDGTSGFSALFKSTWRKGAAGALTKIADTVLDNAEDVAGTLTYSTQLSGNNIMHRVASAGGAGTFRYSVYISKQIHSYAP